MIASAIPLDDHTPPLLITRTVLESELRCIAAANKLMEHGYFVIATFVATAKSSNSTIARISNPDWAAIALRYTLNSASPTEREHFAEYPLAHIYRTFCEHYKPVVPTAIAKFMELSRNVPTAYLSTEGE